MQKTITCKTVDTLKERELHFNEIKNNKINKIDKTKPIK